MKKTLLSISLLAAGLLYSQQVTIPGTKVDSYGDLTTPVGIYETYSLSQQIYFASEIGGPMNISQLKFYFNSPTTSSQLDKAGAIDIWIGHTPEYEFISDPTPTGAGWLPVSQQQKVLTNGEFSLNGNEITFTLDTPFAYNGTDNIVITVDENKAGANASNYPQPELLFYQTEKNISDMTLFYTSSAYGNQNPDPLNPPTNFEYGSSPWGNVVLGKKNKAMLTLIAQDLGIEETKTIGDAAVSPNPSSDFVKVSSKLKINTVDLYDANGRQLMNSMVLKNDQIDIRSLTAGIYLLKINYKEGFTTTKKIIKK